MGGVRQGVGGDALDNCVSLESEAEEPVWVI